MTPASPNHHNHDRAAEAPEAEVPQAPAAAEPTDQDGAPVLTEREPARDAPDARDAPGARDAPDASGAPDEEPEPAAEAYELAGEELDQLTARAARADEYLALAQRKQAEFENYRKRSVREVAAAQERGAVKLAMALLPAVDNLERALEHAPEDPDEHGFVAGVRHVQSDIVAALQKAGIERFSPEGEPFDPTQHEAVAQQPSEGAPPGTVVEVFQRGYRIGETVVRPARVVVAG